jgi:DNA-binding cell septation regulator SpoVG
MNWVAHALKVLGGAAGGFVAMRRRARRLDVAALVATERDRWPV